MAERTGNSKHEEIEESSEPNQGRPNTKNNDETTLNLCALPEEIIMKVCTYLPLNDIHSLANVNPVNPKLERIAKDPSLQRNVHMDLWKGDEVFFSYAAKPPFRDRIIKLTLHCQQDTSKAKTEVTKRMLGKMKLMKSLHHLRIEGAHFTASVFCNLSQFVETLELIDCTSSDTIQWTGSHGNGLRTIIINDCSTFSKQLYPLYQRYTNRICTLEKVQNLFKNLNKFACPLNSGSPQVYQSAGVIIVDFVLKIARDALEEFDCPMLNNDSWFLDYEDRSVVPAGHINVMISQIVRAKYVKVLRLGGWKGITDTSVEKIFKIDSVRELHLPVCPDITDAALYNIPDTHNIELLNLTGCSNVSERAVQRLRTRYTNLTVMF